jgi:hypothetical protein
MFKPEATSLPIYFKDKAVFKNVPLEDGKIKPTAQAQVKEFLLERSNELEDFAPKHLTDEQHAKINEITNFLTGKSSASYPSANQAKPASEDFEFEDSFTTSTSTSSSTETEDDFFSDL